MNRKWQGAIALVVDAVEHGSRAVERIQLETAARPFAVLAALVPATSVLKTVHDLAVSTTHGAIRGVARGSRAILDFVGPDPGGARR